MDTATQSRIVRIFISSTFRDFAGERDLLVRRIFPELRRRCRERQVELVDVDLRWGITEAEAQQGKVLPICLAEIDRARPYFIGLLGERYGWMPQAQQYDPALVQEQPWLQEHAGGKSVTELEILHGVLNNPAMAGHAFFYFRAADYAQSRGSDYTTESPEHREKLLALKSRVRQSGFPVVENYPNPEVLTQRVQEDLWKMIDETYPAAEVPDALALERQRHESYGQSRLGLYLGGEAYLASLNTSIREGRRSVLVTGESGSGKSALLANWLNDFRKENPHAHTFVHHLGATSDAGEPAKLLRRWIEDLARSLGEEAKLPGETDKLDEELPIWLAKASAQGRWIIVLDGLDRLREGRDLSWLPMYVPEGIQLIVSCLPGEVLEAAQRRLTWERTLDVLPLQNEDRLNLIRNYLGRYRKSLTPSQEAQVLQHPLVGNPLFLRTLLEELRIFGVHEELQRNLNHYLSGGTMDDLYQRVLERIEHDAAASHVRSTMEAIWASRAGLSEKELLAVTGLVPAQWAAVQLGLDEAVMESGGRLVFAHDYLRRAVENRYLPTAEAQRTAHRKLGEHFAMQDLDEQDLPEAGDEELRQHWEQTMRVVEESPWQWQQAGEIERLKTCLTNRAMFYWLYLLTDWNKHELLGYWRSLPNEDAEACYAAAWETWGHDEETSGMYAEAISDLLWTLGRTGDFTEKLRRIHVNSLERIGGPEHRLTLTGMAGLADLLCDKVKFKEAEEIYRRVLKAQERILGPDHLDTIASLSRLGRMLLIKGDYVLAEPFLRRVLAFKEKAIGHQHEETFAALGDLGRLLWSKGDYQGAEEIHRWVLAGQERLLGPEHPQTLESLRNLLRVLESKKDYAAAEKLLRRVIALTEKSLGSEHPDTLRAIGRLALLHSERGDFAAAESLYRRVIESRTRLLGPKHPETLTSIGNLGDILQNKGDHVAAEALLSEALAGREEVLGPDHPHTLVSLSSLGTVMGVQGRFLEAETLLRRALEIQQRVLPPGHPSTLGSVHNLTLILYHGGKVKESAALIGEYAAKSPLCFAGVRYLLAWHDCLAGNLGDAKRLIAEEIAVNPAKREEALADMDFAPIHDFISSS